MLKKVLKFLLAIFIFLCEVCSITVIVSTTVILAVTTITLFVSGNVCGGIFALLFIIGIITLIWEWCHNVW